MVLIDVVDDTNVMLFRGDDAMTFRTSDGDVLVKTSQLNPSLLVTSKVAEGGGMWLGSYRRVDLDVARFGVVLDPKPIYSDSFCKRIAGSLDERVIRAHCVEGPVAVVKGKEAVVTGKNMPVFVIPRRWLKPRSSKRKGI